MGKPNKVRYRGKTYPVRDTMRVNRKTYLVLDQLRGGLPGRLQVLDLTASPEREMRCIHLLPMTDQTLKRLKTLSRISNRNENVPTILECCKRDDDIVVVCNWIWGVPLDKYLEKIEQGKKRPQSSYEATRLYRGLAHGIGQLCYKEGVVHGDIKPDNLILSEQKRLVLIDYGAAWTLERMADRAKDDGLTPHYAAPEVLRGNKPSFAGEQFSATVVFYEMLTGKLPFDGLGGMAGAASDDPSPGLKLIPPSRIAHRHKLTPRRFWRQIDAIVARGLQFDPLKRYVSRTDWLDEIEDLWLEMRMDHRVKGRNRVLLEVFEKVGGLFRR